MGILDKKVSDHKLMTEEELARYRAKIQVLASEIEYLVKKPNKTKSDYNKLTIKSREFRRIASILKKARKEALKNGY